MSINEKNTNPEELINIPTSLTSDELINIPTNLSNEGTSTTSSVEPRVCPVQSVCGVCEVHLEACPMGECGSVECVTSQNCNWGCEVGCQSCEGATCQKFCQNCEGDICEGCMTTCEVNASCQVGCQNCLGVACQTSCQNCQGVACQTCQNCEGVSCQICQNCQVGCQNTCEKSCQNCEGACETYCENYCQTACEYCQAYCQLYCQNCEGVSCQTCQDSCQLSCQNGQDPCLISCQALGKWEWSSHVEQGYQLQLTADEWNQFTTRINYTRVCHGLEIASFTAAVKGQQMMASQANEAVNAIKAMNPSVATPSTVTSNSPITAQFINGLANSLNSL